MTETAGTRSMKEVADTAAALDRSAEQMGVIAVALGEMLTKTDELRVAQDRAERAKRRLTLSTVACLAVAVLALGWVLWANQRQYDAASSQRSALADRQTCELQLIGSWAAALGRLSAAAPAAPDAAELLREDARQRAEDMARLQDVCP